MPSKRPGPAFELRLGHEAPFPTSYDPCSPHARRCPRRRLRGRLQIGCARRPRTSSPRQLDGVEVRSAARFSRWRADRPTRSLTAPPDIVCPARGEPGHRRATRRSHTRWSSTAVDAVRRPQTAGARRRTRTDLRHKPSRAFGDRRVALRASQRHQLRAARLPPTRTSSRNGTSVGDISSRSLRAAVVRRKAPDGEGALAAAEIVHDREAEGVSGLQSSRTKRMIFEA
jgi:hypothetical protein